MSLFDFNIISKKVSIYFGNLCLNPCGIVIYAVRERKIQILNLSFGISIHSVSNFFEWWLNVEKVKELCKAGLNVWMSYEYLMFVYNLLFDFMMNRFICSCIYYLLFGKQVFLFSWFSKFLPLKAKFVSFSISCTLIMWLILKIEIS